VAVEACGICGGDGRIANSFGNTTTCPGCHGSGRRAEPGGMRDVTKTKPSHHRAASAAEAAKKASAPTTFEGIRLAGEVAANQSLSSEVKLKLTREIIEYETTHGSCTKTFMKKIRKQVRPGS
jgi:hypothetical protein